MRELRVGAYPLDVVLLPEAGARLHRLRAFDRDLLRTPKDPAEHLRDPFFWGAYVMAPWCNRLAAEAIRVGRQTIAVPPNFADGTAIHGEVYARPWTVDPDGTTCRVLAGGDGWPWDYEVVLRPEITDRSLTLRLAIRNRSPEAMPAGIGLHPWWRRPLEVALDAGLVYPENVHAFAGPVEPTGELDLRQPSTPALGLDATWTALRSADVELAWPSLGIGATLTLSPAADHVVVAMPAEPDATAVEVQTHAPNGLGRLLRGQPGAMRMLDPGEELSLELRLSVSRL